MTLFFGGCREDPIPGRDGRSFQYCDSAACRYILPISDAEEENMGMIGVKRDMIKKKTEIEKNFDGLKKMVGEEAEKIADEYSGGMVTKTKEKIDS